MKYLFNLLFILTACSDTTQSYSSDNYRNMCNRKCQRDFGTDVDAIGPLTGKCYCK